MQKKLYTEEELVRRCAEGDHAAFRVLYEQYAPRLYAYLMRFVNDRETAHDLLQDGFIKVYTSIAQFESRGEGSLQSWLLVLMRNEALQYLRKSDLLRESTDIDSTPLADEVPDTDEVEQIPSEVLMQLLGELPEGYRTVFNLYVLEDKSHREIAEMLGIKERSSASQLVRAKALLTEKIKKWIKENRE